MSGVEAFHVANAARILVVDDEAAMQRMLVNYLTENGMCASAVGSRLEVQRAFALDHPDLIVLDLMLGQDDGLDILRDIRAKSTVPVIMVTGHRREEIDRVLGLELGADDYITKPFGLRELLARMRALLRRQGLEGKGAGRRPDRRKYAFAGWALDLRTRQLTSPEDELVVLTKSEFALLSAFVAAPQRPLSREHLLQATRMHEDVFDRSIDVQILRLRRKLGDDPRSPYFIRTERGVGYTFEPEVQRI